MNKEFAELERRFRELSVSLAKKEKEEEEDSTSRHGEEVERRKEDGLEASGRNGEGLSRGSSAGDRTRELEERIRALSKMVGRLQDEKIDLTTQIKVSDAVLGHRRCVYASSLART